MYYNNDTILFFNGKFVKAKDASIDLYSQSLHYGYAVFEGIKAYATEEGTKIFKAEEHYERLINSAKSLHMPFNYSVAEMVDITYELLRKNNFTNAYIRPLVSSSPNMSLSKGKESYLSIAAWEWTNGYLSQQMRLMTSTYQRPNPDAFHIEAKVCGHYVNSIMACQEAKDKGYDEAILLDANGFIAEGPGANVFIEKEGQLFTPPKGNILPGITRATVFELCEILNIKAEERFFTAEEMRNADAAFFCGTAAEIVELTSLDDITFKKDWKDSLGFKIQQAYRRKVLNQTILSIQNSQELVS